MERNKFEIVRNVFEIHIAVLPPSCTSTKYLYKFQVVVQAPLKLFVQQNLRLIQLARCICASQNE